MKIEPVLNYFTGFEDDITNVEELEAKIAPDDQLPTGFLD